MLSKRIDLNSIPFGLYKTKQDMVKGRLVKFNDKTAELEYAEKDDEAQAFITLRMETMEGSDQSLDTIKKGTRAVAYTLVPNNIWATSEVEGIDKLNVGDPLNCAKEGKLSKCQDGQSGKFVVVEKTHFGSVPAVAVKYLG